MLRPLLNVTTKHPLRSIAPLFRSITYTVVRMGEGDTGGTRSGGAASSDAFTKRETANESKYVRDREMEKLRELKAKIEEHRQQLNKLDKELQNKSNEGKGT